MVRHAPIHRRSSHSDIAICCGRNVRGSSPSTSVVPLSNQVTTLNHKRFKGFKMFSDGHLKHIDPIGTILLPGFLLLLHSPFVFGYAKPVPVNFRALRNPRRDMIWVAAAGPTMNIALAMVAALAFHIVDYLPGTAVLWVAENLKNALIINVV